MAEDHPGAYPHASAVILHFAAIPVTAHIDQNVVGLRLTVETRARRPKRRVPPGLTAIAEELDDVIGRSRQHHNLRDEPIRARIGGIPYEIDCSVEDVLFSQEGDEIGLQVTWCPVDQRGGDCIALRWPVEPSYARRVRGKQLSLSRAPPMIPSSFTELLKTPMPSISTSKTSPGRMKTGRFAPLPRYRVFR